MYYTNCIIISGLDNDGKLDINDKSGIRYDVSRSRYACVYDDGWVAGLLGCSYHQLIN